MLWGCFNTIAEPLRAEVAAAFNKDTLASEVCCLCLASHPLQSHCFQEHYIVGKHLTTYNAGYHLWEKPLKLFEKSRVRCNQKCQDIYIHYFSTKQNWRSLFWK